MYFNGFDKSGKPLWIMKPRFENSKDAEGQVNFIVFCLERGIRLMPDNVEKISIVVDFKGSSMSNNPNVSTCKKFLDILSSHYPERLGVAFMINCKFLLCATYKLSFFFDNFLLLAPWFFLTTYKVISPFVDPITRNKVKFINTDGTKSADVVEIDEYISLKQMEVALGGHYNFAFDMPTYWSSLLKTTGEPYKVIEYK